MVRSVDDDSEEDEDEDDEEELQMRRGRKSKKAKCTASVKAGGRSKAEASKSNGFTGFGYGYGYGASKMKNNCAESVESDSEESAASDSGSCDSFSPGAEESEPLPAPAPAGRGSELPLGVDRKEAEDATTPTPEAVEAEAEAEATDSGSSGAAAETEAGSEVEAKEAGEAPPLEAPATALQPARSSLRRIARGTATLRAVAFHEEVVVFSELGLASTTTLSDGKGPPRRRMRKSPPRKRPTRPSTAEAGLQSPWAVRLRSPSPCPEVPEGSTAIPQEGAAATEDLSNKAEVLTAGSPLLKGEQPGAEPKAKKKKKKDNETEQAAVPSERHEKKAKKERAPAAQTEAPPAIQETSVAPSVSKDGVGFFWGTPAATVPPAPAATLTSPFDMQKEVLVTPSSPFDALAAAQQVPDRKQRSRRSPREDRRRRRKSKSRSRSRRRRRVDEPAEARFPPEAWHFWPPSAVPPGHWVAPASHVDPVGHAWIESEGVQKDTNQAAEASRQEPATPSTPRVAALKLIRAPLSDTAPETSEEPVAPEAEKSEASPEVPPKSVVRPRPPGPKLEGWLGRDTTDWRPPVPVELAPELSRERPAKPRLERETPSEVECLSLEAKEAPLLVSLDDEEQGPELILAPLWFRTCRWGDGLAALHLAETLRWRASLLRSEMATRGRKSPAAATDEVPEPSSDPTFPPGFEPAPAPRVAPPLPKTTRGKRRIRMAGEWRPLLLLELPDDGTYDATQYIGTELSARAKGRSATPCPSQANSASPSLHVAPQELEKPRDPLYTAKLVVLMSQLENRMVEPEAVVRQFWASLSEEERRCFRAEFPQFLRYLPNFAVQ